jgi:hypothetical protein
MKIYSKPTAFIVLIIYTLIQTNLCTAEIKKGILMYKVSPEGLEETEFPSDQIIVKKEIIDGENNENFYQYQLFFKPEESITLVARAADVGGTQRVIRGQDGVKTFQKDTEYLLGQITSLENIEGEVLSFADVQSNIIDQGKNLGAVSIYFPIFETKSLLYQDFLYSNILSNKKVLQMIKIIDTPYKFFLQKFLFDSGKLEGGGDEVKEEVVEDNTQDEEQEEDREKIVDDIKNDEEDEIVELSNKPDEEIANTSTKSEKTERVLENIEDNGINTVKQSLNMTRPKSRAVKRELSGDVTDDDEEEEEDAYYLNYARVFEPTTEYLAPITTKFTPIDDLIPDDDEDLSSDDKREYHEQEEKIKEFFEIFEPETPDEMVTNKDFGNKYNKYIELFQTDIEDDLEAPTLDVLIMSQEQMKNKAEFNTMNQSYIERLKTFYSGHFMNSISQLVEAFSNPDKPENLFWLNQCDAPSIMKYSAIFNKEKSMGDGAKDFFKGLVGSDTSKHAFIKEFIPFAQDNIGLFEGTELAHDSINIYYSAVLELIKNHDFGELVNEMINQHDYNFLIESMISICRMNAFNPSHIISFEFNSGDKAEANTSYIFANFSEVIYQKFQEFFQKVIDDELDNEEAHVSREIYESMAKYTAEYILNDFNKKLLEGFEVTEKGLKFDFSFIRNPLDIFGNALAPLATALFENFKDNILNFTQVYVDHTLNQTGFINFFNISRNAAGEYFTTVQNVTQLLSHLDSGIHGGQSLITWEIVPLAIVIS